MANLCTLSLAKVGNTLAALISLGRFSNKEQWPVVGNPSSLPGVLQVHRSDQVVVAPDVLADKMDLKIFFSGFNIGHKNGARMGPERARALARSCSSPKAKAQVTDDVVSNKHSRVETLTLLSKS